MSFISSRNSSLVLVICKKRHEKLKTNIPTLESFIINSILFPAHTKCLSSSCNPFLLKNFWCEGEKFSARLKSFKSCKISHKEYIKKIPREPHLRRTHRKSHSAFHMDRFYPNFYIFFSFVPIYLFNLIKRFLPWGQEKMEKNPGDLNPHNRQLTNCLNVLFSIFLAFWFLFY